MEADNFDNVPSVPVREELDDVIHIEEVRKAVKQMKCNEASGGDGILAEVYKHGGTTLVHHLHRLFLKIWDNKEVLNISGGFYITSSSRPSQGRKHHLSH